MAELDAGITDRERAELFIYERVHAQSPLSVPSEFERLQPAERVVFRCAAHSEIELVLAGIRMGRALATAGGQPGKAKAKRTTVRRGRETR